MHCELVVPGLFAVPAGRLESVELLLARGRCSSTPSQSLEAWLQHAFGLEQPLPAGALTLLGAGGAPGSDCWVRADPVHLRLMRERLILVPGAALGIQRGEAEALCEALNRHFALRLELRAVDAERWVARLPGGLGFPAASPLQLAGRDVELASGPRAAAAHQLLNEVQMVLHGEPVNEARSEMAINSLWFWGEGGAPRIGRPRWQSLSARDPLAAGLARAASVACRPLPDSAHGWLERMPEGGRHLVVLDALRVPLALCERAEWRDALARLEREWFAPLLAALRAGRIGMVSIHVPDGPECSAFETIRADLRRFWRRPRRLEHYA